MAVATRAELRMKAVARSLLDFDTSYGLGPFSLGDFADVHL